LNCCLPFRFTITVVIMIYQPETLMEGGKQFDQVNRDLEVRDLYNLEDVFHMSKDYGGAYRLHANLAHFDRLDGKTDWPLGHDATHPLTELLLADYLVVDATRPYVPDSFFEIEQATLHGRTHQTCGGRSLNDDAMDTLFTLLVNAGNVSDGVDRPQTPVSDTFHYLAPPTALPLGNNTRAILAALGAPE